MKNVLRWKESSSKIIQITSCNFGHPTPQEVAKNSQSPKSTCGVDWFLISSTQATPRRNSRVVTVLWQVQRCVTGGCHQTVHHNICAPASSCVCTPPPPSSPLSPGGVRIAALLLGSIEAPHEACSQLARASEVTCKWSVVSLLLVLRVRLADPVHA